ncbi:MAG: hypothetical protein L0154_29515 [Chloroflexi bacterium]|nr:hypothetical protein [Chloroflexota bacterium]
MIDKLFNLTTYIRYVAVYRDSDLTMRQRSNLDNASDEESDKYEELLVNPTILKLASQRGNIDCGGLDFVIIRYGHFFQLVIPVDNGHVSVAFEPEGNPLQYVDDILEIVK